MTAPETRGSATRPVRHRRGGRTRGGPDGHRHRAGDDERGDRPAQSTAHDLLVVDPGRARSHRHRPRRRRLSLHARGPADPRLQQSADVGEHRPRRSTRHRRDHRAGAEAPVRAACIRDGDPRTPRPEAHPDPAGRHVEGVLHAWRRRGDRERDQVRPSLHGPLQDPGALSRVPRRDHGRDDAHGRPAPLGERARPGGRHPLSRHAPLGRGGAAAGGGEPSGPRGRHPLRGRADHRGRVPRDHRRHQRGPHPARRLPAGRA